MTKDAVPAHTSLGTAPRECGVINVELGLAESAFACDATRICDLLNGCSGGDGCVD